MNWRSLGALLTLAALALLATQCSKDASDFCDAQRPCPAGKRCDLGINTCVAGPPPGGDLANGVACSEAKACKSNNCVDGVCCDTSCASGCVSCALKGKQGTCTLTPAGDDPRGDCDPKSQKDCKGACDGKGTCTFPDTTTTCGAATCEPGKGPVGEDALAERLCDGRGGCIAKLPSTSCGGYPCENGACVAACEPAIKCTGTFTCVGATCVNALPDGAACGTNNDACTSKRCVDGVCCKSACAGTCEQCEASTGNCVAVAKGKDPDGECNPSNDSTCKGSCDGAGGSGTGGCDFPGTTVACAKQCQSTAAPALITRSCDANGACSPTGTSATCNFAKCLGAGLAARCNAGCATHADCVSGSLCDRTDAHINGRGRCIDPARIVTVTTTIQAAINAVTGNKTHVLIPAGTYTEALAIPVATTITLVGVGVVTITNTGATVLTLLNVTGGSTVRVQGLAFAGATAVVGNIGCSGLSAATTTIVVVESTLTGATFGVTGASCQTTLRRSVVRANASGLGVFVGNARAIIVNNVIAANGQLTTPGQGGLRLTNPSPGSVVAHNTIVFNKADRDAVPASGVNCATAANVTFSNNIVFGNSNTQVANCPAPTYSNVPGGVGTNIATDPQLSNPAANDYSLKTTSPCINKGAPAPAGGTVIDITGGARKKGAATDIGAYELR